MTARVLHVVPSDLHPGTRQQVFWAATRLDRQLYESHVCAMDGPTGWSAALQESQVPVHRVPLRSERSLVFWRRLVTCIRDVNADLIHLWCGTSHLRMWALASGTRAAMVVTHERTSEPVSSWNRWWTRGLARSPASVVLADSDQPDGMPVDQILPPGVSEADVPSEIASESAGRLLRSTFQIDEGAHLIGVVGRFQPDEGLKDAIWAADLLKVVRDDVHVLILGDGPQQGRLERFVEQTRTADRVHFVKDYRPSELLPHLTCFWRTNVANANPTIALLAAAQGLPIVATDLIAHRQLVEDEVSGLLFQPGNRAELARRTQRLLVDEGLRASLGEAGRERVRRQCPLAAYLNGLSAAYQGSLGRR